MDMARSVIGEITEVGLSLLSKRDAEGDTDEKRVVCVAQLIAMAPSRPAGWWNCG
ncbi:hypothetical protein [Oryzicola mucosus]|uniref:Uncharacterized protein n=1 Tax=Oryzicola mucosus TaxID=2767425 RepID=A0A8J6PSC9_9HYPH|nr:hypothetical protein [Oryzicola mucosus]MBD0413086.1 hypothetical protein [Oryzicola mucosus]